MTTLADLDAMDRAALAQLWSELIGGEVPACMSQPMQRRFLAFELQAKSEGGLPAALRARLDRIAACDERKTSPKLQSGARLLREWNGTTHVVDVLPEGFLWNGSQQRSLSAIARAITGARWSGPRVFGLVGGGKTGDRKSAKGKAQKANAKKIKSQRRARAA